ncbi:MAG: PD-(D/E)XK nuclease family protein [Arcanobacterium sp.]|nr:PD-(D/E)XK nuclease family protein [Arcanobacterium sp.]MDY5589194.1 PD-(D/E)XK nuclease family protein [Arcanobacterium sp.]
MVSTSSHTQARTAALSPSRVKDFHNCPLKFRFRMVDQLPEPPSTAALRGTLIHAVLEHMFDAAPEARTEAHAQAALPREWEAHVHAHPQARELFSSDAELHEWLESARPLLSSYFRVENPQFLQPIGREKYVRTQLPSGIAIHGFIDRLDEASNGALRVVDYKSGKSPSPRFQDEYLFQMRFYATALFYQEGTLPARTQLIFLKDSRVLTYDPTELDVQSLRAEVETAWREIKLRLESGVFEPTPNRLCDWCTFKQYCPAFGGAEPEIPADRVRHVLTVQS